MAVYRESQQQWGDDEASAHTVAYGQHDKVSEAGVDRMVADLQKRYVLWLRLIDRLLWQTPPWRFHGYASNSGCDVSCDLVLQSARNSVGGAPCLRELKLTTSMTRICGSTRRWSGTLGSHRLTSRRASNAAQLFETTFLLQLYRCGYQGDGRGWTRREPISHGSPWGDWNVWIDFLSQGFPSCKEESCNRLDAVASRLARNACSLLTQATTTRNEIITSVSFVS